MDAPAIAAQKNPPVPAAKPPAPKQKSEPAIEPGPLSLYHPPDHFLKMFIYVLKAINPKTGELASSYASRKGEVILKDVGFHERVRTFIEAPHALDCLSYSIAARFKEECKKAGRELTKESFLITGPKVFELIGPELGKQQFDAIFGISMDHLIAEHQLNPEFWNQLWSSCCAETQQVEIRHSTPGMNRADLIKTFTLSISALAEIGYQARSETAKRVESELHITPDQSKNAILESIFARHIEQRYVTDSEGNLFSTLRFHERSTPRVTWVKSAHRLSECFSTLDDLAIRITFLDPQVPVIELVSNSVGQALFSRLFNWPIVPRKSNRDSYSIFTLCSLQARFGRTRIHPEVTFDDWKQLGSNFSNLTPLPFDQFIVQRIIWAVEATQDLSYENVFAHTFQVCESLQRNTKNSDKHIPSIWQGVRTYAAAKGLSNSQATLLDRLFDLVESDLTFPQIILLLQLASLLRLLADQTTMQRSPLNVTLSGHLHRPEMNVRIEANGRPYHLNLKLEPELHTHLEGVRKALREGFSDPKMVMEIVQIFTEGLIFKGTRASAIDHKLNHLQAGLMVVKCIGFDLLTGMQAEMKPLGMTCLFAAGGCLQELNLEPVLRYLPEYAYQAANGTAVLSNLLLLEETGSPLFSSEGQVAVTLNTGFKNKFSKLQQFILHCVYDFLRAPFKQLSDLAITLWKDVSAALTKTEQITEIPKLLDLCLTRSIGNTLPLLQSFCLGSQEGKEAVDPASRCKVLLGFYGKYHEHKHIQANVIVIANFVVKLFSETIKSDALSADENSTGIDLDEDEALGLEHLLKQLETMKHRSRLQIVQHLPSLRYTRPSLTEAIERAFDALKLKGLSANKLQALKTSNDPDFVFKQLLSYLNLGDEYPTEKAISVALEVLLRLNYKPAELLSICMNNVDLTRANSSFCLSYFTLLERCNLEELKPEEKERLPEQMVSLIQSAAQLQAPPSLWGSAARVLQKMNPAVFQNHDVLTAGLIVLQKISSANGKSPQEDLSHFKSVYGLIGTRLQTSVPNQPALRHCLAAALENFVRRKQTQEAKTVLALSPESFDLQNATMILERQIRACQQPFNSKPVECLFDLWNLLKSPHKPQLHCDRVLWPLARLLIGSENPNIRMEGVKLVEWILKVKRERHLPEICRILATRASQHTAALECDFTMANLICSYAQIHKILTPVEVLSIVDFIVDRPTTAHTLWLSVLPKHKPGPRSHLSVTTQKLIQSLYQAKDFIRAREVMKHPTVQQDMPVKQRELMFEFCVKSQLEAHIASPPEQDQEANQAAELMLKDLAALNRTAVLAVVPLVTRALISIFLTEERKPSFSSHMHEFIKDFLLKDDARGERFAIVFPLLLEEVKKHPVKGALRLTVLKAIDRLLAPDPVSNHFNRLKQDFHHFLLLPDQAEEYKLSLNTVFGQMTDDQIVEFVALVSKMNERIYILRMLHALEKGPLRLIQRSIPTAFNAIDKVILWLTRNQNNGFDESYLEIFEATFLAMRACLHKARRPIVIQKSPNSIVDPKYIASEQIKIFNEIRQSFTAYFNLCLVVTQKLIGHKGFPMVVEVGFNLLACTQVSIVDTKEVRVFLNLLVKHVLKDSTTCVFSLQSAAMCMRGFGKENPDDYNAYREFIHAWLSSIADRALMQRLKDGFPQFEATMKIPCSEFIETCDQVLKALKSG